MALRWERSRGTTIMPRPDPRSQSGCRLTSLCFERRQLVAPRSARPDRCTRARFTVARQRTGWGRSSARDHLTLRLEALAALVVGDALDAVHLTLRLEALAALVASDALEAVAASERSRPSTRSTCSPRVAPPSFRTGPSQLAIRRRSSPGQPTSRRRHPPARTMTGARVSSSPRSCTGTE